MRNGGVELAETSRERGADADAIWWRRRGGIQAGPRITRLFETAETDWRTLHLSSVSRQVAKPNGSAAQMQRVWFPAMA